MPHSALYIVCVLPITYELYTGGPALILLRDLLPGLRSPSEAVLPRSCLRVQLDKRQES